MKTFLRITALMLALVTCLLLVVACGPSKKKGDYEVELRIDENGVVWAKDEWGGWRMYDELPFDLDYEGETINVLCWDPGKPEFKQTEDVEDARASSIYKRNEAVQARLNVELNYITEQSGASGKIATFVNRVQAAKEAGDHDFDIIATYSRTQGALLMNGLLKDLNAIEGSYLDFEKPWWPSNIVENLTIKDSLYFVSGDISITAIDEMHCVYVNKGMLNERYEKKAETEGYASAEEWLYDMVKEGKWTLGMMLDLAKGTNTGNISTSSKFGLCGVSYTMSALYGASNLRMIEKNDADVLKISDDYTSLRATRLVARLGEFMATKDYQDSYTFTGTQESSYIGYSFTRGRALFYVTYIDYAQDSLSSQNAADIQYGMLPCPKYDEKQVNYYTVIGNAFSIYSVFADYNQRGDAAATEQMLTAILECWASESYRKCTPVVFELNLQLKLSETQNEADMCEIIRASIMFDIGRIMDSVMGGKIGTVYVLDENLIKAAQQNSAWATYYSKDINRVKTNIKGFVDTMNANWK